MANFDCAAADVLSGFHNAEFGPAGAVWFGVQKCVGFVHVDDGLDGGEGFKEMPVHDGLGGRKFTAVKTRFTVGAGFEVDTILWRKIFF